MTPSKRRGSQLAEDEGLEQPLHEPLSKIAWSYSRRSTMEQCPRRYYYEYFGANKLTAKSEPAKAALHLLKAVRNRYTRTGDILHLVIRTYFRKAHQGDVWSVDRLANWARDLFEKDIRFSRSHPDGDSLPDGPFPPVLLREYHYQQPNADAFCAEAGSRLLQALRAFASDSHFETLRMGGLQPHAIIEQQMHLREGFPCRVEGKVDLAFAADGRVSVVDWKSGVEDGTGDDSLQLAGYAMWAMRQFECDVRALHISKAHLGSCSVGEYPVSQTTLRAAKARIIQDAEQMLVMDHYGRLAIVSAFTPAPTPGLCGLCSFQEVCPAGEVLLHA